jgi:hypothetical protein
MLVDVGKADLDPRRCAAQTHQQPQQNTEQQRLLHSQRRTKGAWTHFGGGNGAESQEPKAGGNYSVYLWRWGATTQGAKAGFSPSCSATAFRNKGDSAKVSPSFEHGHGQQFALGALRMSWQRGHRKVEWGEVDSIKDWTMSIIIIYSLCLSIVCFLANIPLSLRKLKIFNEFTMFCMLKSI